MRKLSRKLSLATLGVGLFVIFGTLGTAHAELGGDASATWGSISENERNSLCGKNNKDDRRETAKASAKANVKGRDNRRAARREVIKHWKEYCRSMKK